MQHHGSEILSSNDPSLEYSGTSASYAPAAAKFRGRGGARLGGDPCAQFDSLEAGVSVTDLESMCSMAEGMQASMDRARRPCDVPDCPATLKEHIEARAHAAIDQAASASSSGVTPAGSASLSEWSSGMQASVEEGMANSMASSSSRSSFLLPSSLLPSISLPSLPSLGSSSSSSSSGATLLIPLLQQCRASAAANAAAPTAAAPRDGHL